MSSAQAADKSRRTVLVLSQVYPPDPASVGQHMADVAAEMARRGYRVRVITADRGYDDPTKRYERYEVRDGVEVNRVRWSSFGKKSIPVRLAGMMIFMLHCLWAGLTTRRLASIIVSTSPPMCGFAAAFTNMLRGTPLTYWVMDLNPDQVIALGKMKETSLAARAMNVMQRWVLRRSAAVIALDRFMAARVNRKVDVSGKLAVFPPWPHEDALDVVPHEENPFRRAHGLSESFVIMYSGNHGFSTPVDKLLAAAKMLESEPRVRFLFIGGGVRKKEVDAAIERDRPPNVRSLPYQPMSELRFSLSAADVHIVTMEENVVGIVHPCKIYGAMAVARPILLFGPDPCHASDILNQGDIGWHIRSGRAEEIVEAVRAMIRADRATLEAMGLRAKRFIDERLSKKALCGWFCDIAERTMGARIEPSAIERASTAGGAPGRQAA